MCIHGTTVPLEVKVHESIAFEGRSIRKAMPIDSCIADIVRALDAGGVWMLGSCCGHGSRSGSILLVDGRTISIDQARL